MTTTPPQRAPLHLPFIIVAILVGVGLVGHVVLLVLAPEQAGAFATFFLGALAVVTSFAALVYQLGKTTQQLDAIAANTNGTLSARDAEIAVLRSQLLQAGHTPATPGAPPPAL